MPTIDAQVHAYERDHAARPWAARQSAANAALAASLLVVALLYACVGVALALIYAHASGGVRPLIIMNLITQSK